MRDQSGRMYMRNRYYDPQTAQFTQPDPIGLAGGLNAYGFAAGDPVSYPDPYGLCAEHDAQQDTTRALSGEEDRRLRCIARTRLRAGARDAFLARMDAGLVVAGLGENEPSGRVPFDAPGTEPRIVMTAGYMMNFSEVNVAETMVHELKHVWQRSTPLVLWVL